MHACSVNYTNVTKSKVPIHRYVRTRAGIKDWYVLSKVNNEKKQPNITTAKYTTKEKERQREIEKNRSSV